MVCSFITKIKRYDRLVKEANHGFYKIEDFAEIMMQIAIRKCNVNILT